jgi:hypothetical protein
MAPFYEDWKASAHQDIDCHTCHEYGLDAKLASFIKHIQGVDASEIEQEPPGSPSDELCMTCHEGLPTSSENIPDITCMNCHEVDHYKHILKISGDYDCSSCHTDHTLIVEEETCLSGGCHGQ